MGSDEDIEAEIDGRYNKGNGELKNVKNDNGKDRWGKEEEMVAKEKVEDRGREGYKHVKDNKMERSRER